MNTEDYSNKQHLCIDSKIHKLRAALQFKIDNNIRSAVMTFRQTVFLPYAK